MTFLAILKAVDSIETELLKRKSFSKGCVCQANPEALQVHLCGLWSPEPHRNGIEMKHKTI